MALFYPNNLMEIVSDGGSAIQFTFYDRPDSQSSNLDGVVQLYLPTDLRNPMDINWTQRENGMAVGKALENSGGQAVGGFLKGLGIDGLVKIADFTQAKSLIEQKAGAIVNPYIAMTFESLGFRKFNMEFRFTPHNEAESWRIDEIITKFRRTALPTGGGASQGYPGEVEINYFGSCILWLPMFKPCVITALDVNYSGNGFYAGMKNGFPAETILTLSFSENVLVYRDDVHKGPSY